MLSYISNTSQNKEVLSCVPNVNHNLWIGTADIKDLYVKDGTKTKPVHNVLAYKNFLCLFFEAATKSLGKVDVGRVGGITTLPLYTEFLIDSY